MGFCSYYSFVDLTITIGTTGTSLFLLWYVSTEWLVLPQLVQVNVDLIITVGITYLTTTLTCGVVSKHCNSN